MNVNLANEGTYDPNGLLAGEDQVTRPITNLSGGAPVLRGTVLGKVTATGSYVPSLAAAVDGSQVARAILVNDADATGGAVAAQIYDAGSFNEGKLILGAGHTLASVREDLRSVGIHLKTVQA